MASVLCFFYCSALLITIPTSTELKTSHKRCIIIDPLSHCIFQSDGKLHDMASGAILLK